ncbi:tRNA dihydrouridine synthase [Anaerocolumna sp. MB42-C2]|uniref:tRNA dihydrouridine synthase n=1 Tax=Anaerocolumna sp. MB42-C2 TaxID=3070997 RepID=UPI0027E1F0A1|nr:tRNA-dihydrouridine synthase family protein [Anaerocolumna sp. MB42-C2]WMJ87078.1 tRNA-dihydrouridine synthase family protein [Anaerocolumna sp. MB42-C2]
MKFYFAPMEGLTGYIYRNAHKEYFGNIDKYFSPFIVPNQNDKFKSREIKDILPENNQNLVLVPQILTNKARDFINTSKKIKELGYNEINLNLGCPSGTVVSKGKGAGFLAKKDELNKFLDEIFSCSITKISVKTRIGKDNPDEFYELIEIFNQYSMEELIIHPRVQTDFYKNKPNLKIFKDAVNLSKNPLCYNGNLFTVSDFKAFAHDFPDIDTFMLGRGLLVNPGLTGKITGKGRLDKEILKDFHDKIYSDYKSMLFGDRNVLFKMKEIWFYLITMFTNNVKYAKKIKKSEKLQDYEEVVSKLFREQDILEEYKVEL